MFYLPSKQTQDSGGRRRLIGLGCTRANADSCKACSMGLASCAWPPSCDGGDLSARIGDQEGDFGSVKNVSPGRLGSSSRICLFSERRRKMVADHKWHRLGIHIGVSESKASWTEPLAELALWRRRRALSIGPANNSLRCFAAHDAPVLRSGRIAAAIASGPRLGTHRLTVLQCRDSDQPNIPERVRPLRSAAERPPVLCAGWHRGRAILAR